MKTSFITLLSFLIYTTTYADVIVIDGASQKTVSYKADRITQPSDLNLFNDIDIEYITIINNKLISEKIKDYMLNLLTSKTYNAIFKLHTSQAIARFINYSEYKDALSEYDKTQLINQNVSIDNIDCQVQWLYNNILCLNITTNYSINKAFNNMEESSSLIKSAYVNLNTNTITDLIDLCPIKLQPKLTSYLTRHKNKASSDQKPNNDGIILTDLLFNVDGFLFNITENGFNTKASNGNAFSFGVTQDSISYFLPFTASKRITRININLKPKEVNKNTICNYTDYSFLQDVFLEEYINNQKSKNRVSVYFHQSFCSDTSKKKINTLTYTTDNLILRKYYNNDENEKINRSVDHCYYYSALQYSIYVDENSRDSVAYTYNDKGFITSIVTFENDIKIDQVNYTYDDLTQYSCRLSGNNTDCNKIVFDIFGHSLSHNKKNEPVTITKTYVNNLLMANADELYTYNANNKIEAVERENGRYYTNYYYNSKQQINLILYYEHKQLIKTERVTYDEFDRMTSVTKITTSNGKTQTTYSFAYE